MIIDVSVKILKKWVLLRARVSFFIIWLIEIFDPPLIDY